MTTKQERLKEVYNHLRSYFGIHTQIDFAEAIRITRPALSSAMNGNEAYLTKNLFQKICAAFPGVFDLDYLLTGKGSLLTAEEEVHNEDIEKIANPQPIDQSSLVNAALAAKDETIAALRSQLADLRMQLVDKQNVIDAKDQLIDSLKMQINNLMSEMQIRGISTYPFEMGVAEKYSAPNKI
jgi:transcriptional regulator with XRE-family HTH domain